MRDGRHLVGFLRSYDQFCKWRGRLLLCCAYWPLTPVLHTANLVLEHTVERHISAGKVADLQLGLFLIRGENMVMIAEIVRGAECFRGAGVLLRELTSLAAALRLLQDEDKEKYVLGNVLESADIAEVLESEKAADEAAARRKEKTSKTKWLMDEM